MGLGLGLGLGLSLVGQETGTAEGSAPLTGRQAGRERGWKSWSVRPVGCALIALSRWLVLWGQMADSE